MALKVVYEKGEDGLWFADVPSVRGCHTQGKSVAQARERIREALALFRDDATTVALTEEFKLSAELKRMIAHFHIARAKARAMEQEAQAAARKAAAFLKKKSFTVRDAGEVLDLSHQRVQQLLEAAGK